MSINQESDGRQQLVEEFKLFEGGTGGIDSWLRPDAPDMIFDTLQDIEDNPLSQARLNQLLTLSGEAPMSQALFRHYWVMAPEHPYDVRQLPGFDENWLGAESIGSIKQLYWGLYRFYVDALLFFGSIRTAYQQLCKLSADELCSFFSRHMVDDLGGRGEALPPSHIAKDNRYLISEMACKSYEIPEGDGTDASRIAQVLHELYDQHVANSRDPITVQQLIAGEYASNKYAALQPQLQLSSDDFANELLEARTDLDEKIERVAKLFAQARQSALSNTQMYLSMVGDLDVYIATSMRARSDFREMADFCETVFGDPQLQSLKLRYFDPTLSAAENHEDKGLIECLMVKRAKVLVLNAGGRDSYGKDAEAAMALSLGKPVIIFANDESRSSLFREVHPLSRLINFDTGVAVGAMIASSEAQVVELLFRIFTNTLEYRLDQPRHNYLTLKEKLTDSVVRLQTSDVLLRETFWNHYHN